MPVKMGRIGGDLCVEVFAQPGKVEDHGDIPARATRSVVFPEVVVYLQCEAAGVGAGAELIVVVVCGLGFRRFLKPDTSITGSVGIFRLSGL